MSSSDEEIVSTAPIRTIHQAYRDTLQARSYYQRNVGTQMESWALENLHDAVMDYFEVMRPLVSSMNATERYWEEEQLWPSEPVMHEVAYCAACGGHCPVGQLNDAPIEIGKPCPTCEQAPVKATTAPKTDEDGHVVYHWVEGLQSIDELRNQRDEQEHTYQDALGTHTTTTVTNTLLAPEHLTAIARTLDEALKELKLHAKTDDKLPKGQINNEFDP